MSQPERELWLADVYAAAADTDVLGDLEAFVAHLESGEAAAGYARLVTQRREEAQAKKGQRP